jgi:hypothetical protein
MVQFIELADDVPGMTQLGPWMEESRQLKFDPSEPIKGKRIGQIFRLLAFSDNSHSFCTQSQELNESLL